MLLTGVTGFVGEALLQLLLAELPDLRLTLLVRPQGGTSGADRARAAAVTDLPVPDGRRRASTRTRRHAVRRPV